MVNRQKMQVHWRLVLEHMPALMRIVLAHPGLVQIGLVQIVLMRGQRWTAPSRVLNLQLQRRRVLS